MQRVLSLNQALVESFAEPLILATCQQQLLPDRLSVGNATLRVAASAPERPGLDSPHAEQQQDGPEGAQCSQRTLLLIAAIVSSLLPFGKVYFRLARLLGVTGSVGVCAVLPLSS
jgi:hypothetical protein